MAELAYDDELDLEDENQPKRKPLPPESIGAPLSEAPRPPIETEMSPVGSTLTPPSDSSQPIGQPLQPAAAPRPAYERYEALSAQKPKAWSDLGVGGKIGRVAESIGTAINPGIVAAIPGTEPNRQRRLAGARTAAEEEHKEVASQSEEALRGAEAERNRATAEAALHPPVKPKEEIWKPVPGVLGPGGKILQEEQNSGQVRWAPDITGATPLKPAAPPREPIRVMGDKTYERQQDGSWKEIGPAPARTEPGNYAPVYDPETGEFSGWVNPKTKQFVSPNEIGGTQGAAITPKGTSQQTQSRIDQARAIERASGPLIDDINRLRSKIGNFSDYWKQITMGSPIADPELSELSAELVSFAALQPAAHGARGLQAIQAFEKAIGGIPKDPDALIGAIRGTSKTLHALEPPKKDETPAKPKGVPDAAQWNPKTRTWQMPTNKQP